jgi:hypothetical protein
MGSYIFAPRSAVRNSNEPTVVLPIEPKAASIERRPTPAGESRALATPAPVDGAPAASATPMLDAAQRRLGAIQQQQREARETGPASAAADGGVPAVVPRRSPPIRSASSSLATPASPAVPSGADKPPSSRVPASTKNDVARAQPRVAAPPKLERPPAAVPKQDERKTDKTPPGPRPAADPPAALSPAAVGREDSSPLAISDLRLCRKVSGFGSFDPLDSSSLKAGQHLLVYCELTGLRYEAVNEGFLSRVSSRIEIRPIAGGPVRWDQDLGAAEDLCRRRRRDCYVNYRVELPQSLSPGAYNLRLIQHDLVAHRLATAEIPLCITR